MPWNLQYDQPTQIIEITYIGQVTISELREAVSSRVAMQQKTGSTRILADASGVDKAPSLVDVFDLPTKLFPEKGSNRQTKIALILPLIKEPKEIAEFLETASVNRGWLMKVFEKRHSAIAWLTQIA